MGIYVSDQASVQTDEESNIFEILKRHQAG